MPARIWIRRKERSLSSLVATTPKVQDKPIQPATKSKHGANSFQICHIPTWKLNKLDGINFRRWKNKLKFFITTIKVTSLGNSISR
ncbi:hypothetical protein LINPERHAP2_LOCUS42020 [Linum perenne]